MTDPNCLSYWFPRIEAAGLPVPETKIVRAAMDLTPLCDGQTPDGWKEFLSELMAAGETVGYPCFLRTGHGSAKHDWDKTCFVSKKEDFGQHVYNIVEWSGCVDIVGLPTDVWAVRQWIQTWPEFYAFRGMPITREFRVFATDGHIDCIHPYWPQDAIREPTAEDWQERLKRMSRLTAPGERHLRDLAQRATSAVPGAWSVDCLQDRTGSWWLTDMAESDLSWHWPDCEVNVAAKHPQEGHDG